MSKVYIFNISSGEIRCVEKPSMVNKSEIEDFMKFITVNDIPLGKDPATIQCKQCFGRMYVGRNIKNNEYALCTKCVSKYIDKEIARYMLSKGHNANSAGVLS